MSNRQPIKKTVRFEVFKRDNFTCQYCGGKAPDVVLHVDHINPVAGGGNNDIMNLVTSCEPCNLGKGARELDDNSVIAKQRAQLEDLNERREQLEMMLQWREGLASIDSDQIDAFNDAFIAATNCHLNDTGRAKVKTWLKRHSLSDLLDGLDSAIGTYYKGGADDPEDNNALAGKAFTMIPRILAARGKYADRPYMRDLFYARACIRNRIYCNERAAIDLLEQAYLAGAHVEELKDWAKTARNWTVWKTQMEEWIDELQEGEGE